MKFVKRVKTLWKIIFGSNTIEIYDVGCWAPGVKVALGQGALNL